MNNNCPVLNKAKFQEAINFFNKNDPQFLESIKTCKTKKYQNGGKNMRGGLNKTIIKYIIYIIISILFSIAALNSEDTIREGLQMIINGQCGWLTQRFSLFPNPLCSYYNNFINLVSAALLRLEPAAIAQLTSYAYSLTRGPSDLIAVIDAIASKLSNDEELIEYEDYDDDNDNDNNDDDNMMS